MCESEVSKFDSKRNIKTSLDHELNSISWQIYVYLIRRFFWLRPVKECGSGSLPLETLLRNQKVYLECV